MVRNCCSTWFRFNSLGETNQSLAEVKHVGTIKTCRYDEFAVSVDIAVLPVAEHRESRPASGVLARKQDANISGIHFMRKLRCR
jgi:hypothetical protein